MLDPRGRRLHLSEMHGDAAPHSTRDADGDESEGDLSPSRVQASEPEQDEPKGKSSSGSFASFLDELFS